MQEMRDNINMMIRMARGLVAEARAMLEDARENHWALDRSHERMEDKLRELRKLVDNLSRQNGILKPLVDKAMAHALELKRQAQLLEE